MSKKPLQIMDVTVREGSYAIQYKFTARQVGEIALAIDTAGIPYMEVGNGGGLGVPDEYYRGIKPQSTDIEQLRTAKKNVKKCKIGLMANPSPFTKKEHIQAVKKEVDFLRIAARIDDIEAARENVETARTLEIPVFFQMMRSSKRSTKEIVKAAKKAESYGANAVYVVDTIGWFLPSQVREIILALKETVAIPIGFHAHNNLMLAVANSLAAVEAGVEYVDGSLLGFGRDAGNAQLEALVAVLQRTGHLKNVNLDKLLEAADQLIAPIMPETQGSPPLQIATAHANVCLYPIDIYQQIAHAAQIPLPDLIKKLGTYSESEPDIERVLKDLGKDPKEIFKKLGLA
ncbi:MAG: 4-hydroxy-2-oxovalerate aldolase [Deltaproteobacteria bacterium]|nr:4-hydroxy-2-oxovalerate aldolase [Deltaproteobacteria bacterium]